MYLFVWVPHKTLDQQRAEIRLFMPLTPPCSSRRVHLPHHHHCAPHFSSLGSLVKTTQSYARAQPLDVPNETKATHQNRHANHDYTSDAYPTSVYVEYDRCIFSMAGVLFQKLHPGMCPFSFVKYDTTCPVGVNHAFTRFSPH